MEKRDKSTQIQIVYLSHGGGPLPLLADSAHQKMVDFMKELPKRLEKPDAIIVISAHWEEKRATIQGAANPKMLYDYYGFPAEAYEIEYPAPGAPDLAARLSQLLASQDIKSIVDKERGFDHGLFVPLLMMYPEATIPAIELSLLHSLDPAEHIKLGKALKALESEKILIIGSGFSFHNMGAFSFNSSKEVDSRNDQFQDWLIEQCTATMPQAKRERALIEWPNAPHARYCHPREEHLLPLHICMGMAQRPAELAFDDYILGKRSVAFLWQ